MTDHAKLDREHDSSRAGPDFAHAAHRLGCHVRIYTGKGFEKQQLACFPSMALEMAAKARGQLLLEPGSLALYTAAAFASVRA